MIWKCCLVRIPALVVDGDVGDAALHQPARHQAGLPEGVAAVALPQVVLFLREVEDLARVAQDQLVGLALGVGGGGELRVGRERVGQRVEAGEVFAPRLLPLVGDALRHHAFDGEARLAGVAAGGEGLVARAEEAGFGEAALRLGEHDVGRNQPLVAGVVALEERDHRAHARVDVAPAGGEAGLHHVGGRLMRVHAVRHAADDGVLVRLLGEQREQFADADAAHVGLDGVVERAGEVVAGFGLGVEGIDVAGAAPHPDLDYRFRFAFAGRRRGEGGNVEHQAGAQERAPQGLASCELGHRFGSPFVNGGRETPRC